MLPADATTSSDIDVAATLRRLAGNWRWIAVPVIVGFAAAVLYLNLATYRYAVEMRLAPVATANGDGLSSKLSSLGGLAAVAGVAIPDAGGSSSFKLYIEALHSRDVADILARDQAVMHGVFAREWDGRTRAWRPPAGLVHAIATGLKGLLGIPVEPWSPPGPARLQQWMNEQIGIDQNAKTPVITVSLASSDPIFAVFFLDRLGTTADGMLRQRALLRTDDYIRYLSARLATITLAEQRIAIAQALGEQERLKMAASSNRSYAADVFEHPAASDRPLTPSPIKVLVIATLAGLALGIASALIVRPQMPRIDIAVAA